MPASNGRNQQQRGMRDPMSGARPGRMPQARSQSPQPRRPPIKPPVTTGGAARISLLISFVMCVLTLGAVFLLSMMTANQRKAQDASVLQSAQTMINESIANVQLQPSDDIVQKVLATNVNITVEKGADTTEVQKPKENNTGIGDGSGNENMAANPSESDATNQNGSSAAIGEDTSTGEQDAPQSSADAEGNETQGAAQQSYEGAATVEQADEANGQGTTAQGAGVLVTSAGDILTNLHVVENAKSITATIDGVAYKAVVTGTDASSDLATIKVDGKNLPTITVGDSSKLTEGQWLMQVGNPFGMNDSLSAGYVSALGRNIKYEKNGTEVMYANMIQTDATMNPGNSGGGVYDSHGEFVGLSTVIMTEDGTSSGVGYIIPGNYAVSIAKNLVQGKPAAHAVLGVSLDDVSADYAAKYGLQSTDGALITNVTASGPADAAQMTQNDVIVEFDGKKVKNADDLLFQVRSKSINQVVKLKVMRGGKTMDFTVKMGSDV